MLRLSWGGTKQEAGLRLDTGSLAKTGGDNGAVIVPRDVEHSPLLERISAIDENVRMPPEGKPLTADQIRILTRHGFKPEQYLPNMNNPSRIPGSTGRFKNPCGRKSR